VVRSAAAIQIVAIFMWNWNDTRQGTSAKTFRRLFLGVDVSNAQLQTLRRETAMWQSPCDRDSLVLAELFCRLSDSLSLFRQISSLGQ
jgi:hypothetical protein